MPVSIGPKGPAPGLKKVFVDPSKTPAPPGKPLKPGHPANPNADPGNLKVSYDAWVKAHPGQTKGQSAIDKLLGKLPKTSKSPTGSTFDPLAGMPKQTALTAYPTLDPSTIPDGSDVPNTPAHPFQPGKAQLLDPNKFADLVGAKSYQPLIDALTGQQGRLGAGVADANAMIDKSFGDASTTSLNGAQIVANSNAQSNQSLTDLAARMAQAAGGDPLAAAAVGQTTANQIGANSADAAVAGQVQAAQAAAANRDAGTAKLNYKSSTDKTIADLATALGTTRSQASQAQGKGLEEALGFNSQQQTAQQGRDVAGQEAWLAGQIAGPQITAANLANEGTRAGMKINAHNAAVNDWTNINTGKRQQYLDSVTKWTNKNVAQQMKVALAAGKTPGAELALADPSIYRGISQDLDSHFTTKGGPAVDPGTTYTQAIRQLTAAYPDSTAAAVKALALRYAQQNMPMWNKQHQKTQDKMGTTFKIVNGAPALVKK